MRKRIVNFNKLTKSLEKLKIIFNYRAKRVKKKSLTKQIKSKAHK